jgi:hypothetical protein
VGKKLCPILSRLFSRFPKVDFRKISTPGLKEGVSEESLAKIDYQLYKLKKKAAEIESIDKKIIQLQQSGRTSVRAMNKIHVYLGMRSRLYHRLHCYPYISQINFSALLIFLISFSLAVSSNYTNWMGPLTPKKLQVASIKASPPDDPSIYTGENKDLLVGFSNKETKTVGATVTSKSDRIPNAADYQLSMNLLADGLDIPSEKTLGINPKSEYRISKQIPNEEKNQNSKHFGLFGFHPFDIVSNFVLRYSNLKETAHAEDSVPTTQSSQSLPPNTVTSDKVISGDKTVIYRITDKITARYVMEETKVKEFITIKDKNALKGNTLNFAINKPANIWSLRKTARKMVPGLPSPRSTKTKPPMNPLGSFDWLNQP